MIFWKDFLLDDFIGPLLVVPNHGASAEKDVCQEANPEPGTVKDDGMAGTTTVGTDFGQSAPVQETRQELRPARMAGPSDLGSDRSGEDATQGKDSRRQRGGKVAV
ncbi:MAG: hypothetical protein AAB425_12620 [Bdellovibrionota bacterium]